MFSDNTIFLRDYSVGIIVDNFAGGGGASTGIEEAVGRDVDVAINHDDEAVAMHKANHPRTKHHCQSIYSVDPLEAVTIDGVPQPVWLAWFSPDCKDFSKAKGGKPVSKNIRSLAWVVVHWVDRLGEALRPAIIKVENVEEFLDWGPLDADNKRIPERKGEIFKQWVEALRKRGYTVEWRVIKACDVGAPTIRRRLCLTARCDGLPIVWPEYSHGPGRAKPFRTAAECIDWSIPCHSIFLTKEEGTAVGVKRPLAEATMARIAKGIQRYVIDAAQPFIVNLTHHGSDRVESLAEPMRTVTGANRGEKALVVPHVTKFYTGSVGHGVDEPMHTVTANSFKKRPGGATPLGVVQATIVSYAQQGGANRDPRDPMHTITASPKDQNTVIAATLIQSGYGEREGQAPRALDIEAPLGTVVAGGVKHAVVEAIMAPHMMTMRNAQKPFNGGDEPMHTVTAGGARLCAVTAFLAQYNNDRGVVPNAGHDLRDPLSTVSTKGPHQGVVAAHLVSLKGSDRRDQPVDQPAPAVTAGGYHLAEVRAFLIKYYGNEEDGHELDKPLGTVTTKDRFGLVMIHGEPYEIVDIGMRMLTPRELAAAQGFPADYIIEAPGPGGKPLTKTAQVRMIGNSVCPPLAEALVRATAGTVIEARAVA